MKKFLAILMAAIMVLSMMSFASADGAYDITLWIPEEAVELTKTQIEDFNASNELGVTFNGKSCKEYYDCKYVSYYSSVHFSIALRNFLISSSELK